MNDLPHGVERLIFYDGHCNLCSFWVKFVLQADTKRRFHFAALQTETARRLVDRYGKLDNLESVVLWERDRISTRSTAALRILWLLGGVWRLTGALYIIPRLLRDPIYDFVAKRRYVWFGRRDQCAIVDESVRDRFIE